MPLPALPYAGVPEDRADRKFGQVRPNPLNTDNSWGDVSAHIRDARCEGGFTRAGLAGVEMRLTYSWAEPQEACTPKLLVLGAGAPAPSSPRHGLPSLRRGA